MHFIVLDAFAPVSEFRGNFVQIFIDGMTSQPYFWNGEIKFAKQFILAKTQVALHIYLLK